MVSDITCTWEDPSTLGLPWYMLSPLIHEFTLQWRHNGHDGVSNHQPRDCLLNRLLGRRSKKTSKLRITGLCERNSPLTGEFPAQMASNAENVSHHFFSKIDTCPVHYSSVGRHKTQLTIFDRWHFSNAFEWKYLDFGWNVIENCF